MIMFKFFTGTVILDQNRQFDKLLITNFIQIYKYETYNIEHETLIINYWKLIIKTNNHKKLHKMSKTQLQILNKILNPNFKNTII